VKICGGAVNEKKSEAQTETVEALIRHNYVEDFGCQKIQFEVSIAKVESTWRKKSLITERTKYASIISHREA
jgi:hypothetical protein